ncbi:MAG TPA: hypothetical protein VF117_09880 [Gammaproteobacteria bacterium]
MNKSKFIWRCGVALFFLTTCATAADLSGGVMTGSHATLYLNVDQRAQYIYPVEIWKIDGKLTNHRGVMWIAPGEYTFSVKVSGRVKKADLPGFQMKPSTGPQEHTLKLKVEAGKAYYLGAKFDSTGGWQAVVWKTENSSH